MEENAEPVQVSSYTSIPSVVSLLEKYKRFPPLPKECYGNAYRTAQFAEGDVRYVEGFAMRDGNIFHRHAWNCLGDIHAGTTYELGCQFDVTKFAI